jgi:hypothetical protein
MKFFNGLIVFFCVMLSFIFGIHVGETNQKKKSLKESHNKDVADEKNTNYEKNK